MLKTNSKKARENIRAYIDPIHALPWSSCCATVIDKYGVCWWISI